MYIADEVGNFKSNENLSAMKSGQLSVRNPLRISLTTAYPEDQSVFLEQLSFLKRIYSGLIVDERTFSLLYYADKENLWTDKGIEMANPLRIPENYQEIKDNRDKALEIAIERTEYLCKHMNHFLPTFSGEEFIDIDDLRKCKVDNFDWTGRDVYLGLDLAMTTDNCSVAMVTEVDGKIVADAFAFIPEGRILEKSKLERVDYDKFIRDGKCFSCGNMTVDYLFIEEFILGMEDQFGVNIMGIGFDRYNCLSTSQKLDANGYVVIEVKQHSSILHSPTKLLEESILNGEFCYTENKLYEINFQNAKCKYDTNLNKYINKKSSNGKIDMVASTLNAMYLLEQEMLNGADDWTVQVI